MITSSLFLSLKNQLQRSLSTMLVVASVCMLVLPVSNTFAETKTTKSAKAVQDAKSVNINKASAELIAATLKGVGIKKAERVVEWRKKYGKFKSIEQLAEVKGIGKATIEKNKKRITI